MRVAALWVPVVTSCLLAACGGDGGGGSVTPPAVDNVVARVEVAAPAATFESGQTMVVAAVAKNAAGAALAGKSFSWASSSDAVATVGAGGVVLGRSAGSVTITASAEGQSGAATLTVTPPSIANITLEPTPAHVEVGKSVQMAVTARDAAGNVLAGRTVTLVSSNAAVATVNEAQQVTGVAPGTATVTATAEGKTATATITVVPVPIATLALEPNPARVEVGKSVQMAVTARDAAGNVLAGRTVTLVSSNAAVATVNAAQQVTGVAPGTATLTATAEGKIATATITVVPVPVASIVVTPGTASLEIGATQRLTATPKDAAGNTLPDRAVVWTSGNPAVARVDASGLVTAVGPGGPVTITATAEGRTGTAQITVVPDTPGSILVTRDEVPHSSLSYALVRLQGPDGVLRERQMGTSLSLLVGQLPRGAHTVTMLDVMSRPEADGPLFNYRAVNNNRAVTVPNGGQVATHFSFELASGAVALWAPGVPAGRTDPPPCQVHWATGASAFAWTTSAGPTASAAAGPAEIRCTTFGNHGALYDPNPQAQPIRVAHAGDGNGHLHAPPVDWRRMIRRGPC